MSDGGAGLAGRPVVVGGGHAGLLCAAGLARAGFGAVVIEAGDLDQVALAPFDGRALALMYGSKLVFDGFGAWPAAAPHATPVAGVRVMDAISGSAASYDAAEIGDHPFAFGIENRSLRAALLEHVRALPTVEIKAPARIVGLERAGSGVAVHLEGGDSVAGPLLIGADGRGSAVRRLAGIRTRSWHYHQTALTFAVRHDRDHGGLVREYLRAAGPLALLPIGERLCSITWIERDDRARWLASADSESVLDALRDETGDVLGDLDLAGEVRSWPLGGHVASRPVAPRTVLIGDAAHGTHPIHAQGFNLGVRDVATLIEVLKEAALAGRDLGNSTVLLDHARRRAADTSLIVTMTDGLARLFSSDLYPARLLRGLTLRLADQVPLVKQTAMRRGMGLASGIPRFAPQRGT